MFSRIFLKEIIVDLSDLLWSIWSIEKKMVEGLFGTNPFHCTWSRHSCARLSSWMVCTTTYRNIIFKFRSNSKVDIISKLLPVPTPKNIIIFVDNNLPRRTRKDHSILFQLCKPTYLYNLLLLEPPPKRVTILNKLNTHKCYVKMWTCVGNFLS